MNHGPTHKDKNAMQTQGIENVTTASSTFTEAANLPKAAGPHPQAGIARDGARELKIEGSESDSFDDEEPIDQIYAAGNIVSDRDPDLEASDDDVAQDSETGTIPRE